MSKQDEKSVKERAKELGISPHMVIRKMVDFMISSGRAVSPQQLFTARYRARMDRSKYAPHQGEKEKRRRREKNKTGEFAIVPEEIK